MPTIYPSLAIGAKARLAMFRAEATNGKWSRPMTWRDVRFATLKSSTGLGQGFDGDGRHRRPIWSTQSGEQFRFEIDCHKVTNARIDHKGWYTDSFCDERAIGIVAMLPHGRFIAGYRWTSNDERVYFATIYDDKEEADREAAWAANEHARIFAEHAREHDEKFQEAQRLQDANESALTRLRECIALRHNKCMDYVRAEISELCETIRTNRDSLKTNYADWT